jgi:alpha-2-macroglobulin
MRTIWLAALLFACGNKPASVPGGGSAVAKPADDKPGLELALSNGVQSAPPVDHTKLTPAQKLADTGPLFARAKPLAPADVEPSALRPASTPPPLTGQRVTTSFPPSPSLREPPPATNATAPLHVTRVMPEGKLDEAPRLTVTFDQPMVAITSQTAAAAVQPVTLTPAVKGHWRWIGTRTIEFDPEGGRFPMATTYRVAIAAGTKGVVGAPLAKAVEFTFETPPPKVIESQPTGGQVELDEPILLVFDQRIDPRAVVAALRVTSTGNHPDVKDDPWQPAKEIPVPIQAVDATQLHDERLAARIAALGKEAEGRWLVVRSVGKLAPDAQITLGIPSGLASLEGPNRTTEAQSRAFSTFPPFDFDSTSCGKDKCSPEGYLSVNFTNEIDGASFKDEMVEVVPAIKGMHVEVSGNRVLLTGSIQANTPYEVEIKPALRDVHHQTLRHDVTATLPTGPARAAFWGAQGTIVLDPAAKPELSYFTAQYSALDVSLYKVTPADYSAFVLGRWEERHPKGKLPGTELPFVQVKTVGDGLAETHLDLSAALANGRGQVVAVVEPSPWTDLKQPPPRMVVWAQATHLAIDAHVDNDDLIVFATDLATGAPVADATIELAPSGKTTKTDAHGLATLPRPQVSSAKNAIVGYPMSYLVARHGEDVTVLRGDVWEHVPVGPRLAWETFDDRDLYRPGEEVTIKGWMRLVDPNKHGDIAGVAGKVSSVHYTVVDSESNPITHGDTTVNALGGFDLHFTLPKTPNLGDATVAFEARGEIKGNSEQVVRIEEFRRPDFDATAHAQTEPFVVGSAGDVTVGAHYYAGGPLGGAKVNWRLHADETTYRPPNHDDFVFGTWTAWWQSNRWGGEMIKQRPISDWTFEGKTDGGGEHVLRVDAKRVAPAKPYSVSAEATITAPNNQAWTARTSFVVHPASLYVGIAAKRPFVTQGDPYELAVIGVDIDGKPAPGAAVTIDAVRTITTWTNGKSEVKEVDPQHCAVTTATDATSCKLATPHGGEYTVRATIVDTKGRPNRTEMQFWVAGDDTELSSRDIAKQAVEIIPDKKEYTPGNTAELLIRSPFVPAEGVVTYRRSGIIKTERITLAKPTTVITVPITDDLVPNVFVQVDLVGARPRLDEHGKPEATSQPAYAVGSIVLSVPPRERTLAVTVTPSAAKLAPGDKASVTVTVKDAAGKPVANSDVAVFVVDDSILTLAGYQVADPLATFYQARPTDTSDYYVRAYLQVMQHTYAEEDRWTAINDGVFYRRGTIEHFGFGAGRGWKNKGGKEHITEQTEYFDMLEDQSPRRAATQQEMPDPNADRDGDGIPDSVDKMPTTEIAVRTNFNPLAVFAPAATTNADGSVTVPVTMPDNLTRYRVIAVAAAGERQFGKGESTMTARLPLMVRATPPRFLSFGDTFQLPITLQNQTDAAMQVKLAVRVSNLALTDGDGRVVTVPANDQVLVEVPVSAVAAGTARLQIVAASGEVGDAQELELPVWTPTTTEAFATYGVIDDGAIRQPIALPPGVLPQFGGIEVSTASTNLQALTDALIYLVRYPYECSEQRSSRILAIAGLKDVLAAFRAKDLPSPAVLATSVAVDVEAIAKTQGGDGGFSYWGDEPSVPYVSVYVPFALARAKAKGFAVPPTLFTSSLRYLRAIDDHIPTTYSREERVVIEAFALYTRSQLGDDVHAEAKLLAAAKLPVDAMGWVLAALAGNPAATAERASLEQQLAQHITETAGAASVTSGYGDDGYLVLGSDARSAGIVLDALIQDQPKSDLIPKLVTGLLASRRQGRWDSTQENGFVLIALDRYFQTYEKITPSFVARVWLGADYAGDHAFRGRTTETAAITVPMSEVATHDKSDLVIQKDGSGRLYYRIGTSYAPADLHIEAADHGFVVERSYEGVDDPKDVTRDAQGTWHVKAGARVRVRISMVNDGRRHHVALVDPMPAGFEAVNPELAGAAAIPEDPKAATADRYWWWRSAWYEHQNMRDERVEAFASDLWEGVHAYDYIARATTRGSFVAPPPKAEEMYMPETFGRGPSERVVVE